MNHKGRHHRGYLPHCDFSGSIQFITFRLSDAVASGVISSWKMELAEDLHSSDQRLATLAKETLRKRLAVYEDAGHGYCLLADQLHAGIVQDCLLKNHGKAYDLFEWCIMSNHVHVLIRVHDGHPLGDIVKQWKGASAVLINRARKSSVAVWMRDYHDRFIRDNEHFQNACAYIRHNPVKAGLCEGPEEWLPSSAGSGWTC